jgi:hypothetical protein
MFMQTNVFSVSSYINIHFTVIWDQSPAIFSHYSAENYKGNRFNWLITIHNVRHDQ